MAECCNTQLISTLSNKKQIAPLWFSRFRKVKLQLVDCILFKDANKQKQMDYLSPLPTTKLGMVNYSLFIQKLMLCDHIKGIVQPKASHSC